MGLDGMRVGGGRCPPFLVGALLVACFLLVYNWWSSSATNVELLHQLEELNEQLKISFEERGQCETLRENVEQRYKRMEDELGNLHVRLQELTELKKQNSDVSESLTICKSELDSLNKLDATRSATLETLRLEKDRIAAQLDGKKEEIKNLKAELDTATSELENLKLSINTQKNVQRAETPINAPPKAAISTDDGQLGPVDVSAVKISDSGQRGMKYHGVPILPGDPPGAKRQKPRLSVTSLKHREPSPNSNLQDKLPDENPGKVANVDLNPDSIDEDDHNDGNDENAKGAGVQEPPETKMKTE